MDLALYWREFERYGESIYFQLWDYVTDEVIHHPVIVGALVLLPIVLWRLLKGKD
jgi:hypothetical protein